MPHGINFDWWCAAAVKFRKNGEGVWFRMLCAHVKNTEADAASAREPLCSRTLCTIPRLLAGSRRSMVTQGQLMLTGNAVTAYVRCVQVWASGGSLSVQWEDVEVLVMWQLFTDVNGVQADGVFWPLPQEFVSCEDKRAKTASVWLLCWGKKQLKAVRTTRNTQLRFYFCELVFLLILCPIKQLTITQVLHSVLNKWRHF